MFRVCVNPLSRPLGPTATLIACNFAKKACVEFKLDLEGKDVPKVVLPDNRELTGNLMVARYLCHEMGRYGRDSFSTCEMHKFVDLATHSLSDRSTLPEHCASLNRHLTMRTFLVGQDISVADILVWPTLRSNPRWLGLSKDEKTYTHLIRWYRYLEKTEEFQQALKWSTPPKNQSNKHKKANSKKGEKAGESGSFDIGIDPKYKGKVVTRFPPEPSGFLHIGHAKAVLLNLEIARIWGGNMVVRFDDTNPTKEKGEYAASILADLRTLGAKWSLLSHTSDYFDTYIKICTEMIERGTAYVDDTPVEQMRDERKECVESSCRNNSVEQNLAMWKEMQKGSKKGLKCVVRAKMDMKSANGTLRDPSMYRCNLTPHIRTGSQYKVYPTYDFACPIVDSIEGVTHALRSAEYTDRNVQYDIMWDLACAHHPEYVRPNMKVYSRLNFVYTVLSKRKLNWFVNEGLVTGWDDPRFPTVQGMLRRGLTLEALKKFMFEQGFGIANNLMEYDKLWTENKRVLDPKVPRYSAIDRTSHAILDIVDGPPLSSRAVPLHPKYPERGDKVIRVGKTILLEERDVLPDMVKTGDEVTLIEWGNVIITGIDRSNPKQTKLTGKLNLGGDFKKTRKLSWLCDSGVDLSPVTIVDLDHIITVPKLEPNQKLEDVVRKNTWIETQALGDPSLRTLQRGTIVQLQRRGFAIIDEVATDDVKGSVVMLMIPDGRAKGMYNVKK